VTPQLPRSTFLLKIGFNLMHGQIPATERKINDVKSMSTKLFRIKQRAVNNQNVESNIILRFSKLGIKAIRSL
jgi:hypothetical protein